MKINELGDLFYPVHGFNGLYEVTKNGIIRSLDRIITLKSGKSYTKTGRVLKKSIDRYGYEKVVLYGKNGVKNYLTTHKIVAITFVQNQDCKKQVNHIDGDKLNNNANNLEWCTCLENERHAWRIGLKTKKKMRKCGPRKLNKRKADKIRDLANKGIKRKCIAKLFNVPVSVIGRCIRYESYKI